MAHKVMIDGTAYEIKGGKTMVDGTAYDIQSGKTMVDGTVHDIEFNTTHRITVKSISQKDDGGYSLDTKYGAYYYVKVNGSKLQASIEGVTTNVQSSGELTFSVFVGDLSIANYDNPRCAVYVNGTYLDQSTSKPIDITTQSKDITVAFERSEFTDYEGTTAYGAVAKITLK